MVRGNDACDCQLLETVGGASALAAQVLPPKMSISAPLTSLISWRTPRGVLLVVLYVTGLQMASTRIQAFGVTGPILWKILPSKIQQALSLLTSRHLLKTLLC